MFGLGRRKDVDRFSVAGEDDTSIGNILVELGFVTDDQLKEAVEIQRRANPLGKILVEMGAITDEQLDEALMQQRIKRGEASNREQTLFHRRKKTRLVGEIASTCRDTMELSQSIQAKLQKA